MLGVASVCGPRVRPTAQGAAERDVAGDVHGVGQGVAGAPSCNVPLARNTVPVPKGPAASMPPETVLLARLARRR